MTDTDWEPAGPPTPAYQYYQQTGAIPVGSPWLSLSPDQRRQHVVSFFQNKGYKPHVAEGIADGLNFESPGFSTTAVNPLSGATGMEQALGSRKAELQAQPNWTDPDVQLENINRELMGGDKIAAAHRQEIASAPDRATAKALWEKYFERPALSSQTATTASGHWSVSPDAAASEHADGHDVVWMTPADYLAMAPEAEDSGSGRRMASLMRSLDSGEPVHTIPSFDVSQSKEGNLKITDQDGRNRAAAAQKAGVDLIPVAIKGVKPGEQPAKITDLRGNTRPFDFEKFISQFSPISSAHAATAQEGWQPAGPATPISKTEWAPAGVPQSETEYEAPINRALFAGGVGEAIGEGAKFLSNVASAVPGGEAVVNTINEINNRLASLGLPLARVPEGGIPTMERQREASLAALRAQPHAYGVEGAGEMAPLIGGALPAGTAARLASFAGRGALGGVLAQSGDEDYGTQKAIQVGASTALGLGLGVLPEVALPLARWVRRMFGGPTTSAQAIISRIGPGAPTAQDMMDIAKASSKPLTLADVSKRVGQSSSRLTGLLGRVARMPGEAADIVAQTLGARASERGARVAADVAEGFSGENLYQATKALSEARSATARPLFKAALEPGSTAPIKDILRSHQADAQAEYAAAARDVANLSTRLDARGRPIYRVRAGEAPGATARRVGEGLQQPKDLDEATARATAAAQKLSEVREAAEAAQEAERLGIRGAIWSPRLARLMENPEMRPGIAEGLRILRNEADARGEPFNPRDFAVTAFDAAGEPIISKVPNMRLLQAAKIGLEQKLESFRNPITGQLKLTRYGVTIKNLLFGDPATPDIPGLVPELHRLNPAYAKADAAWAGPSRQMDAAEWGAKVLRMDKNAVRDRMARFSPDEQEFARLGLGSHLNDYFDATDASPARIKSISTSLKRGRMEPMFRSPGEADRFVDSLQKEKVMAETDYQALGNSLTAARLAQDAAPAVDPEMVHQAIGAAHSLAHVNLPMAAYHGSRLFGQLRARGAGLTPEARSEIARALTTPLNDPGSPGMAMLRQAAEVLPQLRRLYLSRYVAGGAGQQLVGGGDQ